MKTQSPPLKSRKIPSLLTLAAVAMTSWTGCAAFHPIHATPVEAMPCSWRAKPRSGMRTIDLSLLRRERPPVHIVDAGDVLAINIPGVFVSPEKDEPIPVHLPQEGVTADPSVGFPVPVREEGSISLPLAGSVHVRGMTVRQVEELLRKKFIDELEILKEGRDRIIVNLLQPRTHRVLVIRQESAGQGGAAGQDSGRQGGGGGGGGQASGTGQINIGSNKRGSGMIVSLSAYENDVLHALAQTSGLPGLDAENAVYIIRGGMGCSRLGGVVTPNAMPVPEHTLPPEMGPMSRVYPPQPSSLARKDVVIRGQSPSVRNAGHFTNGSDKGKIQTVSNARRNFLSAFRGNKNDAASNGQTLRPAASVNSSAFTPAAMTQQYSSDPVANQMAAMFGAESTINPMNTSMPVISEGVMEDSAPLPGIVTEPTPAPQPTMPVAQYSNVSNTVVNPGNNHPIGPPAGINSPFSIQGFGMFPNEYTVENPRIRRIPIRLSAGEVPEITCDDVTLEDGDIVFIESRDSEVYYTGGLLGGGQYTLPRDYDIDIIEALSIAQSTQQQQGLQNNLGGPSVLNQDVTVGASQAIILRKLPTGGQARIKVNLYRAMRNPRERVLIQPGDFIILQYSRCEAYVAFFERRILEGQLLGFAGGFLVGGDR